MKHKGVWIPIEIIHDTSLTWLERMILMEINQLSMLKKGCVAHNDHFAGLFGIKKESASRVINSLKDKNYIEVSIKNRNHSRVITINKMLSEGKQNVIDPLTFCLESEEIKTTNKTTKYKMFIEELKKIVPIPSKVTNTKQGKELFNGIEDINTLKRRYVAHQKEKREYAVRITPFMEDYNSFAIESEKEWK